MRRPLFTVGTTMLFTLFVLCQAESICLAMGCCGLFTALFIICLFCKNKFRTLLVPTVILSVAVSCFLFVSYEYFVSAPYASLSGSSDKGAFTLTEYPSYNDGRYYCMARYEGTDGKYYKVRLSLPSVSDYDFGYEDKILAAEPGDELVFRAYICSSGGEDKSIRQSFKSKGLFLSAYPIGEIRFKKNGTVDGIAFLKREKKRTVNLLLSKLDPETASVGISLLTGDKNLLDNGTYEAVRDSGVAHLLAVSGLHLSVWIIFIMKIIESLGLNKRKWALSLLVFDFLVMFFASFSGSVVRAGIMAAVYLLGITVREDCDSLNSLGFSAVMILLCNPYSAVNVSFLLSFIACYSIITVAAPITAVFERHTEKYLYKRPYIRLLASLFSVAVISVTVSVFTLPVMIYYFGRVSLVSVITNILLIPVSTSIIVSFGLCVMLWFLPALSDFLSGLSFLFTKYLLFCVRLMDTEFSVVYFQHKSLVPFFIVTVLMLCSPFLYEYIKKEKAFKKAFSGIET